MQYSTIFIDLDGTLYPNNNGLWKVIKERISQYLIECLGFSYEEQSKLRDHYLHTYGTTLKGLQIHNKVDTDEYLAYVHNVPLENYIKPNQPMKLMLNSLPQKKWIFTNADEAHANRVLKLLELDGCFDGIIDIHRLSFFCKPLEQAYQIAMEIADGAYAKNSIFIDDMPRNILPARAMGFFTVWVREELTEIDGSVADLQTDNLLELPNLIPGLLS